MKKVKGVRHIAEGKAVYTDAFQFAFQDIPTNMPAHIESDRLIMSKRPGFLRKLFALRNENESLYCGGYYLFDSLQNAKNFANWCENVFEVDGVKFLDRPIILEPNSQLWEVVGAEDFHSVEGSQKIVRFQRYYTFDQVDINDLWSELKESARVGGCTSVWLLKGIGKKPQLAVIYAMDADGKEAAKNEEAIALKRLESWQTPSDKWRDILSAVKVFDRTSWIYMVWHPVEEDDTSPETAQWPISPPLPGL